MRPRPPLWRGDAPAVTPSAAEVVLILVTAVLAAVSPACSSPAPRVSSPPADEAAVRRPMKITPDLLALHEQHKQALERGVEFHPESTALRVVEDRVAIDATASGDARQLEADLVSLGLQHASSYGRVVSGQLPIAAIPRLETLPSLAFARPALTRSPAPPIIRPRP